MRTRSFQRLDARDPRSLVTRVALGLGAFEVVAAGPMLLAQGLPFAALVAAMAMPFAVWGLLVRPLAAVGRMRLDGRPAGLWALGLLLLLYFAAYCILHSVHRRPTAAGPRVLAGGAVMLALVLLPSAWLDRWQLRILRLAWLPALVGFGFWLPQQPQVHTMGFGRAVDAAPGGVAGGARPDLVLISWDTVRADVLSAYGAVGTDTPNLDRLVEEGVLFEDAVAPAPITGPSHASMLTGLYPPSHGLRSNVTTQLGEVATLPEALAASGYRTGGFVSSYVLLGEFGFARGFHRYDDRLGVPPATKLAALSFRNFLWLGALKPLLGTRGETYLAGEKVVQRAATWLASAGEEPQFLFLHFYDAHGPFEPPEELRAKYAARSAALRPAAFDSQYATEWALYRAEIEQLDRMLGEVRELLEARDPGLEHTLLVLTSDHGECFGEAGVQLNHVPSVHEATQHVPLVVRFPGGRGAGTRVAETVTHLDLLPTLLVAGEVDESDWPGVDYGAPLELALGDGLGDARPVYLEAYQDTLVRDRQRKQAWRTAEWKLVEVEDGTVQLFRYREDETRDVAAELPDLVAALSAALHAFYVELPQAEGTGVAVSEADRAALAELGYVSG